MMSTAVRSVAVVAVIGLAACAGSGGPGEPVMPQDVQEVSEPQAVEPEAPAAAEPISNRLKWSTASEVDNFGFDIYRATSEDGPFERITSQPIPGAGTTDEPRAYEFVDQDIEPGVDYFYYVESISVDGVRETFSPIIRAPAKGMPAAGASEQEP